MDGLSESKRGVEYLLNAAEIIYFQILYSLLTKIMLFLCSLRSISCDYLLLVS